MQKREGSRSCKDSAAFLYFLPTAAAVCRLPLTPSARPFNLFPARDI
jgi:hypothetical protein